MFKGGKLNMKSFKDAFAYDLKKAVQTVPNLVKVMQENLVEDPDVCVKTAVNSFNTLNGGLIKSCVIALESSDTGYTEVDLLTCGKNFLPLDIATIKSVNTSGTWNGNTYTYHNGTFTVLTDNENKIIGININGTFSTTTRFYLYRSVIKKGSYIISGGISDDLAFGLRGNTNLIYSTGSDKAYTISADKADAEANIVASNKTFDNVVIKPMVRLATETNSTFEPYIGRLYQVSLGQSIYNGTVDIVKGKINTVIDDTPTEISITPVQVEAIIGENNFTCTISGQSVISVSYQEVFDFDDVKAYADNAITSAVSDLLPSDPESDGTYTLKLTKSGTTITKEWTADTP